MATRLVNNLKDEYLCCRICLDQYRKPKTLPCEHIFCEDCITIHVVQSMTIHRGHVQITCPLCRNPVALKTGPNFDIQLWVKSLPVDTLVESLLQTVHVHESRGNTGYINLPVLCEIHGGKPRDAYCFTHAQLMCWECAARNHRECNVDSSEKAQDAVDEEIDQMKKDVAKQLSRARDLSKTDRSFTDSKAKTLQDIDEMERKLDIVYASAKHQMALLRGEVETCTKQHLDEWKQFYDVVASLLEHSNTLEDLSSNPNTSNVLVTMENVKQDISEATTSLDKVETMKTKGNHFVKFIKDDQVDSFLGMYSSVGFIDSNVPGFAGDNTEMPTPRDAPLSISHILRRTSSQTSVSSSKTPVKPVKSVKTPVKPSPRKVKPSPRKHLLDNV